MNRDLSPVEVRALCALIEKERTTPDQYPLSTNALRSACNQKTSRDPVLDLTESEVDAAVMELRQRGLARSVKPTGSRAWKHRHVITEILTLNDAQIAVLAVLGLRDAQTPGELRQRCERLHSFESVDEVDATLRSLATFEPPLVRDLGRGPGQSQDRWVHLLIEENLTRTLTSATGTPTAPPAPAAPAPSRANPARQAAFRALHTDGTFVMPNPWDRGSARIMQESGFLAVATTSAGHGRSIGKDDQEVSRDELVAHVGDLTQMLTVPLNVDSERLFPDDEGGISRTVELLARAGAAGCSIEDYNPKTQSIDPIDVAAAAVTEAVEACRQHGLVLTARAENHLYGITDIDDTVARLLAYERAGAEVLYAPGLRTSSDVELVLAEITAPFNALLYPDGPSVEELRTLGVRRISTGSGLYNAAYGHLRSAVSQLRTDGTTNHDDI